MSLFSKSICAMLLILICALAFPAQSRKSKSSGEKLITALVDSTTLPGDFGEYRAFLEVSVGVSPDVDRILKLGKKAVPLLIRHLDDKRFFKHITYCCEDFTRSAPLKVSVDEVALEFLTFIVRRNAPMFDLVCVKNAPPSDRCVADGFNAGKFVRRNWQKAYRAGKVHYRKYHGGSIAND